MVGRISSSVNWVITAVGDHLEGLWSSISAGFDAARIWISNVGRDLWNSLIEGFNKVSKWFSDGISGLWDAVKSAFDGLISRFKNWIDDVWTSLRDGFRDLSQTVGRALDDAWTGISQGFSNTWTYISSSIGGLWDSLTGLASDILNGIVEALGSGLQAVIDWLLKHLTYFAQMIFGIINAVVGAIRDTIVGFARQFLEALTGNFSPGSPDKEIEASMSVMVESMTEDVTAKIKSLYKSPPNMGQVIGTATGIAAVLGTGILSIKVLATAADAAHPTKQIGFSDIATTMIASTGAALMMSTILQMPTQIGLITPLRYAYNRMFTPMIPQSGDLVTMVVREAFEPANVTAAPSVFAEYMAYHGFSKEWSDRYWTAHWLPIALRQAYENLWRGLWSKDKFMDALKISDIHPRWREDIYAVAFSPPSIRELGYGFDVGEYSVEDIIKYRQWGGLSPEDARKAGVAMIAYRTEAEREALRREALYDFQGGFDEEAQFRANLRAIGTRDEVIDLWVARGIFRRERDLKNDMVKSAVNDYVNGWSSDNELNQALIDLDVVPEARDVLIKEAHTRKAGKKKADTATQAKALPVSRVRQLLRLGLIGDREYIARLMDHDYSEEDARLDLAIELTPTPLTDEEVQRRVQTVATRRAKAERRLNAAVQRVQDQLDLSRAQVSAAETALNDTLAVYVQQLEVYDLQIEQAALEDQPLIKERRDVVEQRMAQAENRGSAQISRLRAQTQDLEDALKLATQQRDEELAEYDLELRTLAA